jgi:hypothetical protein
MAAPRALEAAPGPPRWGARPSGRIITDEAFFGLLEASPEILGDCMDGDLHALPRGAHRRRPLRRHAPNYGRTN